MFDSLRKAFRQRVGQSALSDQEKFRQRADAALLPFADRLCHRLKDHRKKHPYDEFLVDAPDLASFRNYGGDIETLEGYRRLHEVCAADDINMKVSLGLRLIYAPASYRFAIPEGQMLCIVINPDKPYSESPHAGIFREMYRPPAPRP